jgi:hypothetical protein
MIDTGQVRAYIDATQGELIAVPKLQLVEMLAEVEIGQHARRSITSIRRQLGLMAGTAGMQP